MIKYGIMLLEVCDEKSESYKVGYKDICEIGKERIRRAGTKLLDDGDKVKLGDEDKPPLKNRGINMKML